jgi:hypothetical protein
MHVHALRTAIHVRTTMCYVCAMNDEYDPRSIIGFSIFTKGKQHTFPDLSAPKTGTCTSYITYYLPVHMRAKIQTPSNTQHPTYYYA